MPAYTPPDDCTPVAKVSVAGTRIPLINDGVKVEKRKEGVLDIQGSADVYFPATGPNGGDWLSFINNNLYSVCEIELYDSTTEEYELVFGGIVQAVGPGNETSNEMRMKVTDVGFWLKHIPVPNSNWEFNTAPYQTVLKNVRNTLQSTIGAVDILTLDYSPLNATSATKQIVEGDSGETTVGTPGAPVTKNKSGELTLSKDYQANRDTLATVVGDLQKHTDGWFSIEADPQVGVGDFIFRVRPANTQPTYTNQTNGGTLQLIENNMVSEISPINAVEVRGKPNDNEQWPFAIAVHTPSVKAANDTQITSTLDSQTTELTKAQSQAKRKLKDMLDTAGFGNATTLLKPQLEPYDELELPFKCDQSIPLFSYEIERVTHHAGLLEDRSGGRMAPKTEVQCSFAANYNEIELADSGTRGPTVIKTDPRPDGLDL